MYKDRVKRAQRIFYTVLLLKGVLRALKNHAKTILQASQKHFDVLKMFIHT